jgi:hypothetical protein
MEHDGASIETISISANSHEIRTLGAPPVALSNIGSRKRLPDETSQMRTIVPSSGAP